MAATGCKVITQPAGGVLEEQGLFPLNRQFFPPICVGSRSLIVGGRVGC